jgi:hypothetical protein
MLNAEEQAAIDRNSAPVPSIRPPTYAWGAMGMRESTEAPTLFYKMHEIERVIRELQAEIVELRRVSREDSLK